MEQNASALPKVTLGQYKGLDFTRRVRPVSEKAVELEASNPVSYTHLTGHFDVNITCWNLKRSLCCGRCGAFAP